MLFHQSIGLDHFNELSRQKAVYALFECAGSLTWAQWVSDGRPFANHEDVHTRAEDAILHLSDEDIERIFPNRSNVVGRGTVLTAVTHARIERMLGPEGGYPEY
ncbi:hypothetical protein ABH922_000077 [Rhodococcus sp. 27YEA15]|uniref:2-oxo-4-hydroxy-4-carboxy-5-ureidoimidazoline decarboxylase n=1 Tax=Rhodococcus sp. 27YEA15 TaxID=3156259 RepID=UPI003C7B1B2C